MWSGYNMCEILSCCKKYNIFYDRKKCYTEYMSRTSFDSIQRYRDKKDYTEYDELLFAEKAHPRITDSILAILVSATSRSVERSVLFRRIEARYPIHRKSFNTTLHRMKKKNIISSDRDTVRLMRKKGIITTDEFEYIYRTEVKEEKVIVIFDIPETHRKHRDWIRAQLKMWNFTMIQKSVWMGHAPIPKKFISRLISWKLDRHVKILNVM